MRFLLAFVSFLAVLNSCVATAESKPNIVYILLDDAGYGDISCYGQKLFETPHIDKLAAEGLRFTNAYAQPLCTPTRVQIMTGKYNHRN